MNNRVPFVIIYHPALSNLSLLWPFKRLLSCCLVSPMY
jgi:hypothetical protein